MPTVLVLGATGRLGLAATQAFAAAGWRVLAQCRPRPVGAPSPAVDGSVRWLEADVHQTRTLTAAAGQVDVVVHAMNPPYTASAWRAQAGGLMQAAIDASLALEALLMFPGNVYNFGAGMPALLRVDTPQRPTTAKGEVRVALERQLAAAGAQGLRSVVIRAGDFFGEGSGTLFDRMIVKDLRRGRMTWPGSPDATTPWAYLPDLARAFVAVAERRDRIRGAQVVHFAGHRLGEREWRAALTPIARREGWLAAGDELASSAVPWRLLRLGGLLLPTWASVAEMRYLWHTPHALDNGGLLDLIGHEPRTPLGIAVPETLRHLGFIRPQPQPA